ncbi:RHS repeat-associated core domain-containing protein [Glycomyces tritici]|uniref:RHS repeat-associated core domain-containing protein n=1 Tax=Glycomyces tritici TaxID=2665176 RepID=A0ABT7YXG7_9ACTN|nr:RHS repeat-associated core domain-containing protein [Glycomyces tritici]MDN3243049.1 RHS repeat-associated core domain-containing protein [Glycomyces tritici]
MAALIGSLMVAAPALAQLQTPDQEVQQFSSADVETVGNGESPFSDDAANWAPPGDGTAGLDVDAVQALAIDTSTSITAEGASDVGGDITTVEVAAAEDAGLALGDRGLAFTVEVPIGADELSFAIDYAAAADRFGGDWVSRLDLVVVPACASASGLSAECQLIPLQAMSDDSDEQTLRASVSTADLLEGSDTTAGGGYVRTSGATYSIGTTDEGSAQSSSSSASATVAVLPSTNGNTGNWTATDLSAAGSWTSGTGAGSFEYAYPITLPPATGPLPDVGLSYSSASHDGATSATNNQASWIGDGWEFQPGLIERTYTACGDDAEDANNAEWPSGDLCWKGKSEAFTLSLAGVNASLIKDAETGAWTMTNDNGWKVELLGSSATASAASTEHWKVTTTDGTQYFFAGRADDAKSRWTIPVFGNHSGEPCYKADDFAGSSCDQGFRWMLDRIVDTSGNETHLTYTTETGKYAAAFNPEKLASYTRWGYLERIDYGIRAGVATGRVEFTLGDRCLSNCRDTAGKPITANWPDTPWDLACDTTPCWALGPSFYASKRLTGITTKIADGTGWKDVDSWSLVHEFKHNGTAANAVLWLASIQHTGKIGGTLTLPATEFGATFLANRVDVGSNPNIARPRLSAIKSESGGVTSINYSSPDCAAGNLPGAEDSNARRCFPVWYTPEGLEEPQKEYFHKYVVDSIGQSPAVGGGDTVWTTYQYSNAGAGTSALWAWDDSEFNDDKYRTYNQWRGYSLVTTLVGDPADGNQLRSSTRFLRGMNNQPRSDGSKRAVAVTDSRGKTHTDHEALAGTTLETLGYNGTQAIQSTVVEYWTKQTASRTHDGGRLKAWKIAPEVQRTSTWLTGSAWQTVESHTTYDDRGRPYLVEDLGVSGVDGDELCAKTWYAENTTKNMVDLPSRTQTLSVPCDTGSPAPGDVISDDLYYYDHATSNTAAPDKGRLTQIDTLVGWDDTTPKYEMSEQHTYDDLGRIASDTNALGKTTTTAYTPATGPLTQTVVTNPLGHKVTTALEPAWGEPVSITDPNGILTQVGYNPLGFQTGVWLPGRAKATQKASLVFTYAISQTAPTTVTTETITATGTYVKSVKIFDGLLRQRQTQTDTYGGRLLTQAEFDSRGLVTFESGGTFNNESGATGTLVAFSESSDVSRTQFTYDGAGRTVEATFKVKGAEQWSTQTLYGSIDGYLQQTTIPPAGDTPTSVLADARGQAVELRQYHGADATGEFDATKYTYEPSGAIASVTDPVGNQWTYDYDVQGRLSSVTDPDTGTTTMSYDKAGQVIATVDENETERRFAYDAIGRQTQITDAAGKLEATFTYDLATKGIGHPYKSTRYVDDQPWTTQTSRYSSGGQPLSQTWTLPSTAGTLANKSYSRTLSYAVDGSISMMTVPAVGGLNEEIIYYKYDALGGVKEIYGTFYSTTNVYLKEALYSPYTQLMQRKLGDPTDNSNVEGQVWQTWIYEEGTGRLSDYFFDKDSYSTEPTDTLAALSYEYNPAGNITSITDANSHTQVDPETQCFEYDYLKRLTEAWTQAGTGECAASVDEAEIGGLNGYGRAYTYDKTGNRTSLTEWTTAGEVTHTYGYKPGKAHQLQEVVTTGARTGQVEFIYDEAGNTSSISRDGNLQTLKWDQRDRIKEASEGEEITKFIDTAAGERLFRSDPDGSVTAYVAGMEITGKNGAVTATRYYEHYGQTIAVREGQTALHWIGSDHHGTASWSVNAVSLDVQVRRYDSFGVARDTASSFPGQKGFVGGTENDSTGFTTIGAREYLAETGRFLSRDLIAEVSNPQQLNGYAYAMNNPVLYSDSTGMWPSWDDIKSGVSDGIDKVADTAESVYESTTNAVATAWDATTEWAYENRWEIAAFAIETAVGAACIAAIKMAKICSIAAGALTGALIAWWQGKSGEEIAAAALEGAIAGLIGYGLGKVLQRILSKYLKPSQIKKFFGGSDEAAENGTNKADDAAEAADDAPRNGGCNSFIPGTQVVMADDSTKPIEEVHVGDEVVATDMTTGETGAAEVSGIKATAETERELVTIGLSDKASNAPPFEGGSDSSPEAVNEDGAQTNTSDNSEEFAQDGNTITATAGHAYWAAPAGTELWIGDSAQWTLARDLTIGAWLRTSDGTWTQITAVTYHTDTTNTRNLTVAGAHTFYVTNGSNDTLVHNCPTRFSSRIDGYAQHLTLRDLQAVKIEVRGGIVGLKRNGRAWNHVREVWEAMKGLKALIKRIKRDLGGMSHSDSDRAGLYADLSRASRLYDRTRAYLGMSERQLAYFLRR